MAHLAVWRGGAPGVPPEGSLQGACGVCEHGEVDWSCRVTARQGAQRAASREYTRDPAGRDLEVI